MELIPNGDWFLLYRHFRHLTWLLFEQLCGCWFLWLSCLVTCTFSFDCSFWGFLQAVLFFFGNCCFPDLTVQKCYWCSGLMFQCRLWSFYRTVIGVYRMDTSDIWFSFVSLFSCNFVGWVFIEKIIFFSRELSLLTPAISEFLQVVVLRISPPKCVFHVLG